MTPDEKIAAFLAADRPAEPDLAFDAVVMQRVAVHAFARSLTLAALGAAAAGVALWASAPVLMAALEPASQALSTGVGVLVATVSILGLGQAVARRR